MIGLCMLANALRPIEGRIKCQFGALCKWRLALYQLHFVWRKNIEHRAREGSAQASRALPQPSTAAGQAKEQKGDGPIASQRIALALRAMRSVLLHLQNVYLSRHCQGSSFHTDLPSYVAEETHVKHRWAAGDLIGCQEKLLRRSRDGKESEGGLLSNAYRAQRVPRVLFLEGESAKGMEHALTLPRPRNLSPISSHLNSSTTAKVNATASQPPSLAFSRNPPGVCATARFAAVSCYRDCSHTRAVAAVRSKAPAYQQCMAARSLIGGVRASRHDRAVFALLTIGVKGGYVWSGPQCFSTRTVTRRPSQNLAPFNASSFAGVPSPDITRHPSPAKYS